MSFLKATAATLLVAFLILAIYAFRSEGDSVTPVTGILFLFTVYMIPFAVIWSLIGEGFYRMIGLREKRWGVGLSLFLMLGLLAGYGVSRLIGGSLLGYSIVTVSGAFVFYLVRRFTDK